MSGDESSLPLYGVSFLHPSQQKKDEALVPNRTTGSDVSAVPHSLAACLLPNTSILSTGVWSMNNDCTLAAPGGDLWD
jgi:hypothetical protein